MFYPISPQKKEFLGRKNKEEQEKLKALQNKMAESNTENPIETMKAMNVSDVIIQQVQTKIETEARGNVQSVMGHAGYETYD